MLKSSLPSPRRKRIGIALCAVFVAGVAAMAWAEQPKRAAPSEPQDDEISTDLRIKVDGRNVDGWTLDTDGHERSVRSSTDFSEFTMNVKPGSSFNFRLIKGPEIWQIAATPERSPDGKMKLSADLSHNGAAVSHPVFFTKAGEPAGIKIGEESAEGRFKGFEAQITMMSSPATPQVGVVDLAKHASYRSITRIDYPAAQAKSGIGGTVLVIAHVGVDGQVVSTSLKAGPGSAPDVYPLVTTALAGVQRWTFNPAQRDGKAVPSDEIVPVVFEAPIKRNTADLSGALDAITVRIPQMTADVAPADQAPNEDVQFRMSMPPKYPTAAIKAHQSGKIVLKVLISETGEPLSATVETATPPEAEAIFADASIAAVMNWRFNPGLHDGKPYEGYALVPFTYALTDDDDKALVPAGGKDNG